MQSIKNSKHNQEEKSEKTIEQAKKTLLKIEKQFRKNKEKIGKYLSKSIGEARKIQRQENTLTQCLVCKKGDLRILYNKKAKRYFIGCSNYPECRTTYTLPPNGLIKPSTDKEGNLEKCQECGFPLLVSFRKGKRPWKFCFNPQCPSNEEWQKKKEEYKKQIENSEN